MARVYDLAAAADLAMAGHGKQMKMKQVARRFRGHRKMALGTTPPALRYGIPEQLKGCGYKVIIEVGPEDIQAPEFLDVGFYAVA
ncbi:MAG: hypothetical protein ACE5FN_02975 [Leptospirillia bacterium]